MASDRWEKERECIHRLTNLLTQEVSGGVLGQALECLIEATGAAAAVGFVPVDNGFRRIAERGFPSAPLASAAMNQHLVPDPQSAPPPPWQPALELAAAATTRNRRPLIVADVASSEIFGEHRDSLVALSHRALVGVAARYHREVRGVLVLMGSSSDLLEPDTSMLLEMLAGVVALALEREQRVEQEEAYRAHLAEAGQMASLGILTATVAQELRGPVGALTVQLDEQRRLVQELRDAGMSLPKGTSVDLQELTEDMRTAAAQIATTVGQLMAMSRREPVPDRLDLAEVVREALLILRGELAMHHVVVTSELDGGCLVNGRRDSLRQVAINLILHAADVSARGKSTAPSIALRTRIEQNRVVLAVDDSGPGVSPHRIESLFHGFSPAADEHRAHALPLRIAHDVVTAHHGHIEVVNLPERGASVRVILPRLVFSACESPSGVREVADPVALAEPAQPSPRRVFIVDDDDLFTRTMKRALRPHEIRTAATASEAELILADPEYDPQMVLCDLGLPGLGGDMLHARLKARRPEIAARFVFVTGGACSKEEADYLRSSGCPTLLKPIDVRDILEALRNSRPPSSVGRDVVTTLRPEEGEGRASEAPTLPPPAVAER